MNEVGFFDKIKIGSLDIQFFSQNHYRIDSLGIRINNFVYSCDVLYFYEESKKYLKNIDHWILDCTGYTKHHTHASLETVLKLNEEFKPKNLYLTNMGHEIDYHKITEILPNNIKPLYDSYKIICD
jgi:phosphoribosyl 1,2-cyclic phosphate phosphodiesterase